MILGRDVEVGCEPTMMMKPMSRFCRPEAMAVFTDLMDGFSPGIA